MGVEFKLGSKSDRSEWTGASLWTRTGLLERSLWMDESRTILVEIVCERNHCHSVTEVTCQGHLKVMHASQRQANSARLSREAFCGVWSPTESDTICQSNITSAASRHHHITPACFKHGPSCKDYICLATTWLLHLWQHYIYPFTKSVCLLRNNYICHLSNIHYF